MAAEKLDPVVFATGAQIQERIGVLSTQINTDYQGKTLDVICLINGASVFCADLIRQLRVPVRLHHLGFTSYAQGTPSGEVRMTLDLTEPLYNRHVLVVEGIIVSGRTPKYVVDMMALRQPASLAVCALGIKRAQLAVVLPVPYVAFELDAEMVVGYGIGHGDARVLPNLVLQ